MKFDIHAHIVKDKNEYAIDELLADMTKNDIEKRVISTFDGDTIKQGNEDVAALVRQYPDKLIGCALLNPALHSMEDDIEHALSLPEIKMIELNSFVHGYYPDHCEGVELLFQRLAKQPIPIKVFSGLGAHALPHQWERYVKKYPMIPFVFLHLGCFDYGYGCVDIIKRNANAYAETSNQYELQILKKAFSEIDINKIVFGSSYPERFTRNGYEIYDLFPLSKEDREQIEKENTKILLKV